MNKEEYYKIMCNFSEKESFNKIHKKWYACFSYILKSFKVGFREEAIKSLFYHFDMENWKAMWKENSVEYANHSKEELINEFCGECHYISDRTSYDRLFRTHWLFKQAFKDELNKLE